MAHFYAATSQRSTAVTCSVKCRFLDNTDTNLVVCKGNRLEVYSLQADEGVSKSLLMSLDVQIFGRIVSMHAYTPQGNKYDITTQVLFLLTEHHYFCVLGYDPAARKATKRAAGDLKSSIGQRASIPKSALDPSTRMVAMHLYDGHLKILPMPASGGFAESFDVRLPNVTRLLDMGFLHGASRPTLVLLHEDDVGGKHLKTFYVDTRDRDLSDGPWGKSHVDLNAHSIVPAPTAGVVIISQNIITYYGGSDKVIQSVAMEQTIIVSHAEITDATTTTSGAAAGDGGAIRYLLGDDRGVMYSLSLCRDSSQSIFAGTSIPASSSSATVANRKGSAAALPVTSITLDTVGSINLPSSMTYLGDGVVYIGSYYGDSQLVQLRDTPVMVVSPSGQQLPSYVDVLDTYTNIGPILDMSVVASEKQGQDVVVTCSGAYGMGSLRVIRSGIGVDVQAQIELPGIKGVWSLSSPVDDAFDKYLVQSFLGETRVLGIEGEDMEECELPGLDSDTETIFCGNIGASRDGAGTGRMVVQVTAARAVLLHGNTFERLDSFSNSEVEGAQINLASVLGDQLVLCFSGGAIVQLQLDSSGRKLVRGNSATLANDIACTSIWSGSGSRQQEGDEDMDVVENGSGSGSDMLLACAMWTDHTVRVLSLPSLQEVLCVELGLQTQAREVLIVNMTEKGCRSSQQHLLVGLGDGTLMIYELHTSPNSTPTVSGRKLVTLGKKPIALWSFKHHGDTCVFATGDRPTVVHIHNDKLMFTVVNVPETTGIARFHCQLFPGCLALTSPEGLLVGSVDDIQRLHIQTHKIDGDPRRISYHSSGGIYAVCTEKTTRDGYNEVTLGQVLFLLEGSFDPVHAFELDHLEQAISCISCVLDSRSRALQAKGTSGNNEMDASEYMREYVVVGTAYLTSQECEAGRLLVFSVVSSAENTAPVVSLVAQTDCNGAVYSICGLSSGVIAAGIDYTVKIFRLENAIENTIAAEKSADVSGSAGGFYSLIYECGYASNILVLYLKAYGDMVLNGDMMRSLTLMQYCPKELKQGEGSDGVGAVTAYELKEVSRDMNTNYMRAVEFVGGEYDDHYIGADDSGNLFSVRRRIEATSDEERGRMFGQAEMHLGDHINVLRPGTLSSQAPETAPEDAEGGGVVRKQGMILYGTVSGAVGSIINIDDMTYFFLLAVQKAVLSCVPSMGGLPHDKWRSFKNERRTCSLRNFIDGDVVESILEGDYDRKLLEDITHYVNHELNKPASGAASTANSNTSALALSAKVAEELYKYTVEEVLHKVEEMQRIH